jgi:energy-coupling factor transport system permease protein
MMRDFRYQKRDTNIQRLHPVVKLTWGIGFIVLSLIFDHPLYILALLFSLVPVMKLTGIWREWASVLKLLLWLGVSIIVVNALVSHQGNHILAAAPFTLPVIGRPVVTMEALAFGAVMALKLLGIISAFIFINLTVHPDDIMSVMLKLRFPYKSVLVTSMSTRFIPCLVEDVQRITDAYRTRGVLLDTGNWVKRLKKRAGIIVPLLSNSLDRAVQVAEAMEARAFGTGEKRVFYKDVKLSPIDLVTLTAAAVPLTTGCILRVMKYGSYQFYPNLEKIAPHLFGLVLVFMLLLILIAIIPLSFLKRRVELD